MFSKIEQVIRILRGTGLPSWRTCEDAVKAGTATRLEKFIYDHCPASLDRELKFRSDLLAIINGEE